MHYLEQLAYKYKTTIDFREDTMLAKLKIKLKSAENKKYSYNISSKSCGKSAKKFAHGSIRRFMPNPSHPFL